MGEFVHEAFAIKMLRRCTDTAARAHGDMDARVVIGKPVIWREVPRRYVEGGILSGRFCVRRSPRLDGNRPAVFIEGGTQARDTDRAIGGVDEIFLARP